ncbi:MAG: Hpt domain-containing protein [Bacteroidia bacterium]|jgi:HPt (histidine-containing phosphotransfer) domain-containing protein|nr:Hpt domain-containing protein [Bacteroidia bacterium]
MENLNYGTYYNLNYLAQIAGGDKGFVMELTKTFIDQTPELVKQLHVSVLENDYNSANYLAHRLKSSCEMLGMAFAASICLKIELAALNKRDLIRLIDDAEVLVHQLTVSTMELTHVAA